jgi:ABC-type branched-subunit amino acid transport system substrate-binding protein
MALRGTVQSKLGTETVAVIPAPCKNVVLVHTSDEYGNTMADPLKKYVAAGGGSIVKEVDLGGQAAQASYSSKVADVVAVGAQADCQILIAFPGVGAQYIKDFRTAVAVDTKRDWKTFNTIASNGLYNNYKPVFIQASKLDDSSLAAEGVIGTFPDTNPSTHEFDEFKALYAAQYGTSAEVLVYSANAFDAAILAALAIEAAGTATDGTKIRDSLFDVASGGDRYTPSQFADAINAIRAGADIDYKGASGDVSFDDFGDVLSDYVTWKVENGKFVTKGRITADETKP